MFSSVSLNSIGLILDIIGAVILFFKRFSVKLHSSMNSGQAPQHTSQPLRQLLPAGVW